MFVDVVPILRLPKRQRVFTYSIPEQTGVPKPGSLVRIPWRKQKIDGIVLTISTSSPIKNIQPILSTQESTPSWTPAHVKTFIECADRLYCSYSDLASQFLPAIPKRATKAAPVDAPDLVMALGATAKLSSSALEQLQTLVAMKRQGHQLLRINHAGERFAFYRLLAKQHQGQILVLAPTRQDAEEIAASLRANNADKVFLPNPKAGKHEQWNDWQAVRDGNYRIIVTTRSGILLPCQNLSCLIIDQEERPEHAQWEAQPRYDSRELALSLATNQGIPIWSTAYCPRVQTAASTPTHAIQGELPPLHTVIHTKRNPIEEATEQAAFEHIDSGKSVLFVTPHKARARTMRCMDCQQAFVCGRCRHPLFETATSLRCPSCNTQGEKPLACPRCKSLAIRSFGLGMQGLAETLTAYKRAPVVTLQGEDSLAESQLLTPNFIVSTPYACKRLLAIPHAPIGCVILFHPESLLFSPTHTANELYYRLIHWHRMYAHDYEQSTVLVQSGLTLGHPLHTTVAQNDYASFLESEIALRRSWLLPPFGTMIHLSISATDEERESLSASVSERLKSLNTKTLSVIGPRVLPGRDAIEIHWLIRTTDKILPNLDKTLETIYNRTIITVNPERNSF
jgi:primosomal protein N'